MQSQGRGSIGGFLRIRNSERQELGGCEDGLLIRGRRGSVGHGADDKGYTATKGDMDRQIADPGTDHGQKMRSFSKAA